MKNKGCFLVLRKSDQEINVMPARAVKRCLGHWHLVRAKWIPIPREFLGTFAGMTLQLKLRHYGKFCSSCCFILILVKIPILMI